MTTELESAWIAAPRLLPAIWSSVRRSSPNKTSVTPKLAGLPIDVREGTILPIAPLTQRTDEIPVGPLTLRVYAGDDCHGDRYQDDGKSFAFRSGQFLRLHVSCAVKA
jgi:alpha-glucosidase